MERIIILIIVLMIYNMPVVKGAIGEGIIRLYLLFLDKDRYVSYHDLYIPKEDGTTTQIDHVVLSPFGIFVIETKNYGGWIFGSESGQYWTQTIYRTKNKFYNPIAQNRGHIKYLKKYLTYDQVNAYQSIIVFTMRATLKKLSVRTKVIYSISLLKTIKGYREVVLSPDDFMRIKTILDGIERADWKTRRAHVRNIKNYGKKVPQTEMPTETVQKEFAVAAQVEEIVPVPEEVISVHDNINSNNICPKCGAPLVERVSKKGKFTGQKFKGCSNFPTCRYTEF